MHRSDILHRDLKPENIVISHVIIDLFRESARYATSAGLSMPKIKEKHAAEPLTTHVPRWLQENRTVKRSMCGRWA
jgi:serine/threonine protein kinase